MSASKEKKRRQEQYASGQLEKTPAEAKGRTGKRLPWIITTVCVLVMVLAAGFFAVYSTGFFERHTTAATVGEHKLSPALYNFFYQDVKSSVMSSLGLTDPEADLSQYPYDDTGKTYADYLQEEVDRTISQNYALYDAAMAEGFTLPAADQSYLDTAADNLTSMAANYNYPSAGAYLTAMYGKGSDVKTFENYVQIMQYSSSYSTAHGESLTYTTDEISAYYDENKAALDTVSYHIYECSVPTGEIDEEGYTVFDLPASKAQADAIIAAAAGSEEIYNTEVAALVAEDQKESYANGSATLKSDQLAESVPTDLAEWLFDEGRQYGDTTVVPSGTTGYSAVFFVDNAAKYNVEMVNVRHILRKPADAEDEASVAEAKKSADDILAQFQAGEQTEDAFAALATELSEDEGTKLLGGLMENMQPGQTVETFDAWSFDPARQPGDTAVIESSFGAHVMYFSGSAGTYKTYRVVSAMRSRDTNAWAEELASSHTIVYRDSATKLVNT